MTNDNKQAPPPSQPNPSPAGDPIQMAVRRWCIERSIAWCKPSEDTTEIMIDQAALIERYLWTGKHSPVVEVGSIVVVLQNLPHNLPSLRITHAVAQRIASYVEVELLLPEHQSKSCGSLPA